MRVLSRREVVAPARGAENPRIAVPTDRPSRARLQARRKAAAAAARRRRRILILLLLADVTVGTLAKNGEQFSGTVDRLQRFIGELAADRDPVGEAIAALDNGTASLADLLTQARPPLRPRRRRRAARRRRRSSAGLRRSSASTSRRSQAPGRTGASPRTMSAAPSWICWAPLMAACSPDPHNRLTVSAGTSTGMPAFSAICRAP